MLKTIKFYVGTQTGDGVVSAAVLDSVRDELVTLFDGLTEECARGFWRGPDGKLWDEPSIVWTVLLDPAKYWNHRRLTEFQGALLSAQMTRLEAQAREYAKRLCARLGQQCVLVVTQEGGELIYAPTAP